MSPTSVHCVQRGARRLPQALQPATSSPSPPKPSRALPCARQPPAPAPSLAGGAHEGPGREAVHQAQLPELPHDVGRRGEVVLAADDLVDQALDLGLRGCKGWDMDTMRGVSARRPSSGLASVIQAAHQWLRRRASLYRPPVARPAAPCLFPHSPRMVQCSAPHRFALAVSAHSAPSAHGQ